MSGLKLRRLLALMCASALAASMAFAQATTTTKKTDTGKTKTETAGMQKAESKELVDLNSASKEATYKKFSSMVIAKQPKGTTKGKQSATTTKKKSGAS